MFSAYETTIENINLPISGNESEPKQVVVALNNKYLWGVVASMITASANDGYFRILSGGRVIYPNSGWHRVASGAFTPVIPVGVPLSAAPVIECYTPNGTTRDIQVMLITSSRNYEVEMANAIVELRDEMQGLRLAMK